MPSVKLPSKELAELQQRFKQGYTVEPQKSGHFRILDRRGEVVRNENGQPVMLPSTPHGGRTTKNIEKELEAAQVLQGTRMRPPSPAAEAERRKNITAALRERQSRRQAETNELRGRLLELLKPIGTFEKTPGLAIDVAQAAATFAPDGQSPDLIVGAVRRFTNGTWVEPRYRELVEQLVAQLEQADDVIDEWYSLIRDARGIPDDLVEVKAPAAGEWPFEVQLLSLEATLIDHEYQRPVAWPFVRREAARFDPSLVGTIDVAERRQGAVFAVLDGQQRIEICRMVGKTTVYASVYRGLDRASEARFFLHKNRDRKVVHPFYTYRARITAKDPIVLEMDEIVKRYGYKVAITAPQPTPGLEANISAIAALEEVHKRGVLDEVLKTLRATTLGLAHGQNNILLRGLGRFTEAYWDDYDEKRLRELITARGPSVLLARARERHTVASQGGGGAGRALALSLLDDYNRGLPAGEKLSRDEL